MDRIIVIGKANSLSAQLAALWPVGRVPDIKFFNRSEGGDIEQNVALLNSTPGGGMTPGETGPAADPRWCKHCDGEGRIWGALTNNPSEREGWHTCGVCGGDGMAKVAGEGE